MTNETRQRIESYQELLPNMKEKVAAALIMLVLALSVAVTATYAWITISRAPEVSSIATTMAANGNLEIALSNDEGTQPEEFDIDEGVKRELDINGSNLQWGNLINLGDSTYYGIDELALRPARLNTGALRTNPLQGASYGTDGRVTELNSQYSFFKWDKTTQSFVANNKYGVRAIASYTVATSDASNQEFIQKYNEVQTAYGKVADYYNRVFKKTIAGLGTGMNTFLQAKVNTTQYAPNGATSPLELKTSDIDSMLATYQALYDTMKLLLEAQASLANLQQYMFVKSSGQETYAAITAEELYKNPEKYNSSRTVTAGSTDPLDVIMITGLETFVDDYKKTETNIKKLTELRDNATNGEKVTSKDVEKPLYDLCQPNTAKIDGTPAKDLMNDKSKLVSMALGGDCLAQFDEGLLARFEQYGIEDTDRLPKSKKVSENAAAISVKTSIMNVNITGHLCTGATGLSTAAADFSVDTSKFESADKNAQDTYGMAMDFWVRTNAEETLLTLEGALVADSATGEILSYDGVNRIWGSTGNTNLTTDSTTQGGGSCYIYYADNPADVARSLALLKQMKVAFVDAKGTLLATASMDTEDGQYYAQNGRITVPLTIDEGSGLGLTYTYKDETEKEQTGLAISQLTMDNPQRITAIIYLDGTGLDNTMVLSSAEIQGQLNIQFGSSVNLKTSGDNRLLTAERKVTAEIVGKSEFDFFTDADKTVKVNLTVDGATPSTVKAFFVREITSTQGSREGLINFNKTNDTGGTRTGWEGSYGFTAPGTYHLRYVQLDGVDYALTTPLTVVVKGFSITGVEWNNTGNERTVYSTESSHQEPISITISATNANENPDKVTAIFERSDGRPISVSTSRETATGKWKGTASFTGSGDYTLSYVIVDGKYQAVPSGMQKKLELHLGLKAAIRIMSKTGFDENNNAGFETGNSYSSKLYFRVTDDSNDPIEGVKGVTLTYTNGSAAGTHAVDAAWNDAGYYEANIVMTMAGRYSFSSIKMGENTLTRATEAPVFTLISPDPPIYIQSSQSTWHGEKNIQFIPNSTDAILGPIGIQNTANDIQAVLYNDIAQEYFVVNVKDSNSTEAVNGYITAVGENKWNIKLPTYTKIENGVTTTEIDGTWSLVCLKLWNCYKNGNFYDAQAPLIWLGTSDAAQQYKAKQESGFTAHENLDFSLLDTTVSNHVVVNMTTAKPALGSGTTAFMTEHPIGELGISVRLTDAYGRLIPATGSDNMYITLTYLPKTAENYGYKVSGYPGDILTKTITLENSNGSWVPNAASAGLKLQYVGEYTVKLNINGKEYTHATNEVVPEKYTVTSAGPTAANLGELKVTNTQTFGMEAATITGKFLGSYPLGITVTPTLTYTVNGKKVNVDYVAISDAEVNYTLNHTGNSMEYGGYTWSEDTTNPLTAVSGTLGASGTGYASTGSQQLLAGTYTGTVSFTWKGKTTTADLQPISVYSVQPEITVTGVEPAGEVLFNANTNTDEHYLVANAAPEKGTNTFGTYYAVVFMQYEPYTAANNPGKSTDNGMHTTNSGLFAHYIPPKVTLQVTNTGSRIIADLGAANIELADNTPKQVEIGTVGQAPEGNRTKREQYGTFPVIGALYDNYVYSADTFVNMGSQTISDVTSEVNGVTYTRTLVSPVTISQTTNNQAATLFIEKPEGVTITVKANGSAVESGKAIAGGTLLTITATADKGYHSPSIPMPEGAIEWRQTGHTETVATYECLMSFSDMTLTGSAVGYPVFTFTGDTANAAVTAQVGGESITSGDRVKPGETVTVTVTARAGRYAPSISGSGIAGWQQDMENSTSYKTVYTFPMPETDTAISNPSTSEMVKLTWDNTNGKLLFTVVDTNENNREITDGYVIPGHTVRITVEATGGLNPTLTSPADAVQESTALRVSLYRYKVTKAVTLLGECAEFEKVTMESDKVLVTAMYSSTAQNWTEADKVALPDLKELVGNSSFAQGVAPGNWVQITLMARKGYYLPEATNTGWTKVSGSNSMAVYKFQMPETGGVTVAANATPAPTVTPANNGTTMTLSGVPYDGVNGFSGNGAMSFQPDTTVTVTVKANAGYYAPTVTQPAGVTNWKQTGEYTYTFTMGTQDVTIKAEAKAIPKITAENGTGASISMLANGKSISSGTAVMPNTVVTVKVTKNGNYYNPTVSATGGVTLSKAATDTYYDSVSYTFTMGTQDVKLTASAIAYPNITVKTQNQTIITVAKETVSNGTKVIPMKPGTVVTVSVAPANNYEGEKVDVAGAHYSNNAFTMPTTNVTVTGSATKQCVAAGTLITLADGTMVPVETLTGNEKLLIYDHEKGCYSTESINFIEADSEDYYNVINLCFNNGVTSRVIYEHAFFDLDLMKYVYITEDSYASYVGHRFYTGGLVDGEYVSGEAVLAEAFITNERTVAYSLVTDYHLDYFTDGLLSIPGGITGLFNIFEYDEGTLQYNVEQKQKDIETYGLCSYEEFKDVVSYDTFMKYPTIYFKVSIGKGIMTEEDLQYLIERYALRYNEPSTTTAHVARQQQSTVALY